MQNAAAGALTARFGEGPWSALVTERGAELAQRHARVRVGKSGKKIVTVAPTHQGRGLGKLALEDAVAAARKWPADAIRLDAFDADAGAGSFYAKCGFSDRGRVVYKGDPLVYYELLLP